MKYDPETGVFTWKYSGIGVKLGSVAGSQDEYGYVRIGVDCHRYKAHRLAWLYVKGYFPEHGLDHRDRIKHHNWIDNLREVTQVCNLRNTGNRVDNTSGCKGVWLFNSTNKWVAEIMVNGIKITLGHHISFSEAVCHRLAAEQAEDWDGCDSSSPAYQYVRDNIQSTIYLEL